MDVITGILLFLSGTFLGSFLSLFIGGSGYLNKIDDAYQSGYADGLSSKEKDAT